jgi:hypothetical protein
MNTWRAGVVEVVASTPHKASSALAVPEGLRQVLAVWHQYAVEELLEGPVLPARCRAPEGVRCKEGGYCKAACACKAKPRAIQAACTIYTVLYTLIDVYRLYVPFWLLGVVGADLRPDSILMLITN